MPSTKVNLPISFLRTMSKSRKDKKYIPKRQYNPAVLSRRIEKLSDDLEHHKNLLLAVNKANDLHVEHLSNFVRHDMKNAIQGIDGILYNAGRKQLIPSDVKAELSTALGLLRSTLDNFTKLIPSPKNNTTTLPAIFNAVEMLSRSELQNQHIKVIYDFDRKSEETISYPFQSLVQVLYNLVINAINSLRDQAIKQIFVKGEICGEFCKIMVYDTGPVILEERRELIFNYGYSTTGGSGIGLFHARSVITEMDGSILVCDSDMPDYTKCFIVEFKL